MGARIRTFGWSRSALGDPSGWSQSLKTLVSVMLAAKQPMFIAWGNERTLLYNDPYVPLLGHKHPTALGQPFLDVWAEVRSDLAPLFDRVFVEGEPVHMDDINLTLNRRGQPEEAHFGFSYTPVRDEHGGIGGLFCACMETTDQVFAERRRKSETERQRRLFEQAPGFITILSSPDHVFEFVNRSYVRLFGDRDFVGRTVREVFPELEGQGFFELLDQVYASGERFVAHNVSARLQRSPGATQDERFLDFIYEPVTDDAGAVTGIFCEGHDVTETHLAQAALRESEEFNRRVLASSNDCIKVLDLAAKLTFMSEGGLRVMEVSDFNVIKGCPWPDFWEGQGNLDAKAAVDAAKAGHPGHFQGLAHTMAGNLRYWDVQVTPILGADGSPDRILCVSRDITVARRAEEALRDLNETLEQRVEERTRERDLLATVLETTDVMFLAADFDYNIVGINKANANEFERIYGLRPKLGDNMLAVLADQPEHQAQVRAGWARGLAGEEVTIIEDYGDPRRLRPYYEIKLRTLRDEYGKRIGCYQFVTDITDRLRNQAELAQAQEALRQSQKMEAVGQLTGGVAHDFNNLLTVIKSSTDLLKRPDLHEERRQRYIGAISDTVDRAAKLTGQLLAFARRQSLRPEVFNVGKGVEALSDMIGTLIGSRIEIVTDLPDAPCFINADPSQFDNAIVNMAVNARDAMNGKGRLTISVHPVSTIPAIRSHAPVSGDFVAVCIEDTGSGISAEDIGRIFEPFFTTKEVGQGTGLGLSQVFGFAKQSGGEVRVQSEVGEGTMFVLYLPRKDAEAPAPATEPEPLVDGHGTRVLVVEDNVDVGNFATQTLAELGYETVWVTNAEAALAELVKDATHFDVVFSDVVMPGMNGIDLGHEIRRHYHDLPVVLVSGYSHVLAQNGTYGFELLHKPYSVEQLSRTLRKVASWRERNRNLGL